MRRHLAAVSVGAALLGVVGCGDTAAPVRTIANADVPPYSAELARISDSYAGLGLSTENVVIPAQRGSVRVGGLFTISFPDRAVCDPETSSYGPGHWDESCVTLAEPLKVRATYGYRRGQIVVDFSPDIRFRPSAGSSDWVTIATDAYAPVLTRDASFFARDPSALGILNILYAPTPDAKLLNEAKGDASLVTHIDLRTGQVWRRIKHFSGYSVVSGEECELSPDNPDCVEGPPPTIEK
jgi:hypothetical protein